MVKAKPLLIWAGALLVGVALLISDRGAGAEKEKTAGPESARADLIKIDTLAAYQKLELPPVTFLHDEHTEALLKENKGCDTCHLTEDGKLSLTFKRQKGTKPAEIKDLYHANCIGCHQEMAAAAKKSGPLDGFCRDCHNANPPGSARLDAGLNKIAHFRHVDSKAIPSGTSDKENCGVCHHEYDKKTKKIFYAKGKESSCRYCHLAKPAAGVSSLEQASHQECVLCHLDLANKGWKENGPYVCSGCHGAAGQVQIARKNQEVAARFRDQEVPRLKRGQPDAALISFDVKAEEGKGLKPLTMNPVAFDHQAHEKYNDTCRACHHASLEACGQCHTLSGTKEGKFVTLEQSMHLKSSQLSCLGCHAAKQADAKCAGCHNHMVETGKPDDPACKLCHLTPPSGTLPAGAGRREALMKLKPQEKASLAATMLQGRIMNPGTYPEADIPEKAVIKELSDKYQPVELAHREHVQRLLDGMKDSKLASYFHSDAGTMCQGCHHNSPPSKTPPRCGNCHAALHGKTGFDPREANRPGLLAAFHGQCMACHKNMEVLPPATACTECHEEKKK